MPIGSNLVLSHQARGGALRVRSDDSEAELKSQAVHDLSLLEVVVLIPLACVD